ncbi:MAG: DUF4918 family protein [Flavobacteriales bacterium]|nr:DUF4918 family protein [Flavobacteriales bacterium]
MKTPDISVGSFADRVMYFNEYLAKGCDVPDGVTVLNPYVDKEIMEINRTFYARHYNDDQPRVLVFGINPGRFGGGVTGVSFTDPYQLDTAAGIPNPFDKKKELSSTFIYMAINAFGGVDRFYRHFFLSAVCPLGFTSEGKNINYYDCKDLQTAVGPFILDTMRQQVHFSGRDVCVCIGGGENLKYLEGLNAKHRFFSRIIPLPHPRFVMQYRRKKLDVYLDEYKAALESVIL